MNYAELKTVILELYSHLSAEDQEKIFIFARDEHGERIAAKKECPLPDYECVNYDKEFGGYDTRVTQVGLWVRQKFLNKPGFMDEKPEAEWPRNAAQEVAAYEKRMEEGVALLLMFKEELNKRNVGVYHDTLKRPMVYDEATKRAVERWNGSGGVIIPRDVCVIDVFAEGVVDPL